MHKTPAADDEDPATPCIKLMINIYFLCSVRVHLYIYVEWIDFRLFGKLCLAFYTLWTKKNFSNFLRVYQFVLNNQNSSVFNIERLLKGKTHKTSHFLIFCQERVIHGLRVLMICSVNEGCGSGSCRIKMICLDNIYCSFGKVKIIRRYNSLFIKVILFSQ